MKHGICSATDAGHELAEKGTPRPIVRGLVNAIEYFDKILPNLVQNGQATEDGLVALLADDYGEDVKRYKIRCRLKWLAGLGLGASKGRKLVLSEEGTSFLPSDCPRSRAPTTI